MDTNIIENLTSVNFEARGRVDTVLEFRAGGVTGPLLGTVDVLNTGGFSDEDYVEFETTLTGVAGHSSIFLVVQSGGSITLRQPLFDYDNILTADNLINPNNYCQSNNVPNVYSMDFNNWPKGAVTKSSVEDEADRARLIGELNRDIWENGGPTPLQTAELSDLYNNPAVDSTDEIASARWMSAGFDKGLVNIQQIDNRNVYSVQHLGGYASPNSSATWHTRFTEVINKGFLSYNVMFKEGTDFVKGGKLPGLCGGNCPTGGSNASEGYSVRYNWKENGHLIAYIYHPEMPEKYGDTYPVGKVAAPGEWVNLAMSVTSGANGSIKAWVNGELKLELNGINLPGTVERAVFHNFYGGNGPNYASDKIETHYFDDINICQEL